MTSRAPDAAFHPLDGVKVLELGGERADFCGRLLAGAGADVVKLEPPGGSVTRSIGPFYEDVEGPERSLYFWHYNLGKRGIILDLTRPAGRETFRRLAAWAGVVLDGRGPPEVDAQGFSREELLRENPALVVCSITPFGFDGPFRDHKATDLIQLALGGQMMMCGYDPPGEYDHTNPSAAYDTPPIAPQMWQAYHTAGVQAAAAIVAALFSRDMTGQGQYIDCAVHDSLAGCTESGMTAWIYNQRHTYRQTGRHAGIAIGTPSQLPTADGRYAQASMIGFGTWDRLLSLLQGESLATELADPKYADVTYRRTPEAATRVAEVLQAVALSNTSKDLVAKGQAAGLAWAQVVRPEENLDDPHWQERRIFQKVSHPELGKSFDYVAIPWLSEQAQWKVGPRAPLVGEHNHEVLVDELGLTEAEFAVLQR